MNILIRVNTSYKLGSGHYHRSIKLAKYLSSKYKIYFCSNIFKDSKITFNKNIISIFESSKIINNEKENKIINKLINVKYHFIDILIIDTNEFLFKPTIKIANKIKKIIQITDIYKEPQKNIFLINQNYYQRSIFDQKKSYSLVPNSH